MAQRLHKFWTSHRDRTMAPIELTLTQSFEVERLKRDIDAQSDTAALCAMAKDLLKAWYSEKAVTKQAIQDQMTS
jgi:hypothetical protein